MAEIIVRWVEPGPTFEKDTIQERTLAGKSTSWEIKASNLIVAWVDDGEDSILVPLGRLLSIEQK